MLTLLNILILDSSAVLTEDTDSFIIGQKVWVSGSKPGHIAFIGETQFAPGEWAGIALDEAIGWYSRNVLLEPPPIFIKFFCR